MTYGSYGSSPTGVTGPAPGAHSPTPAPRPGGPAGVLLLLGVLALGLLAGLFFTFDLSIMPGLKRLDDVAYLTAMRDFNDLIDNSGPFGLLFCAAFAVLAWGAVSEYRRGRRNVAAWAAAAAVLYVLVLGITFTVNIPLNTELADLGDPSKAKDLSLVHDFQGTWETANIIRTVLTTAALACVAHSLRLYGRWSRTA
ncbi:MULTISPECIES: DUF1772 domain-containing protein [Streptomyces]|uniref:DUF1772 domain-containing protein n=1 Tax=Streptomyces cacaoi TaxID=1898 RepID=A0A4Y3R6S1_STRCI|nr:MULTISPECIES: DUF1772 domain-containing protein [Streptomyces]NNG86858.1 DUF1772 domain-containing protein [Streptomyces cacaoi]QHF97316.1 DUF1772 domain-containing protein [Streptomyces sp. NHF165]GEB52457.1 hypothetical protein SCA03_50080 [Streptomyces cacaoi]